MKKILTSKKFLSIYALWVLIQTFLLLSSDPSYNKDEFWPFCNNNYDRTYDVSEWVIYVVGPIVILFIITSFDDKNVKLLLAILCTSCSIISLAQSGDPSAKFQPRTFNWETTHADRFVTSPCYSVLGFDPDIPYEVQLKRYEDCEHGKNMHNLKNTMMILVILAAIIGIVFYGYKTNKKPQVNIVDKSENEINKTSTTNGIIEEIATGGEMIIPKRFVISLLIVLAVFAGLGIFLSNQVKNEAPSDINEVASTYHLENDSEYQSEMQKKRNDSAINAIATAMADSMEIASRNSVKPSPKPEKELNVDNVEKNKPQTTILGNVTLYSIYRWNPNTNDWSIRNKKLPCDFKIIINPNKIQIIGDQGIITYFIKKKSPTYVKDDITGKAKQYGFLMDACTEFDGEIKGDIKCGIRILQILNHVEEDGTLNYSIIDGADMEIYYYYLTNK